MASKSVLWSIIWFLVLLFVGFAVAGFCAGWYILILPFTVCIDGLKVSTTAEHSGGRLASHPVAPGSIPGIPKKNSEENLSMLLRLNNSAG